MTSQKRPYKNRSWVWDHFSKNDSRDGQKITMCNICKAELVYISTTTTMRSHLFYHHHITKKIQAFNVDPQIVDQSGSQFSESDDDNDQDSAQTKMSKRKISRLNDDLVNFIAKSSQPLSIVEDENFIRLVIFDFQTNLSFQF